MWLDQSRRWAWLERAARRRRGRGRAMILWAAESRGDDVLDDRLDRTAACEAVEKMRAWVDELLAGPES
jgi:hypothetical protein